MAPDPLRTPEEPEYQPRDVFGGVAYSQQVRAQVLEMYLKGELTEQNVKKKQEELTYFPCYRTCIHWREWYEQEGHMRPYKATGNRQDASLRGHNLILLAMYRLVYPKATHAELNAFLMRANYGDDNARFFCSSQFTKAEDEMCLTRKKGSTTAYQAALEVNIEKRRRYWNLPYPFGIADVRAEDMVDVDESGLFVEKCNRGYGKAYINKRVKELGPYAHGEKWTLLMAICGQQGTLANPSRRWVDMYKDSGTTEDKFVAFIRHVLGQLPHGDLGRWYCFIMDNLKSHHATQVKAAIYAAGHKLVFRAPYYPIHGPIEYVFNTIQRELNARLHHVGNGVDLRHETFGAIQSINDFLPYFRNCGYWR